MLAAHPEPPGPAAPLPATTWFDQYDAEAVAPVLVASDEALRARTQEITLALQAAAEAALTQFLVAHGKVPTEGEVEGFRLLALQRQGARGDPSFNACRESCREMLFHCNVSLADEAAAPQHLRFAAMVCRHLLLFLDGKLQVAGLGDFCCAAKPLRSQDAQPGGE